MKLITKFKPELKEFISLQGLNINDTMKAVRNGELFIYKAETKREILYHGITNLKNPYILSEHKLPL